MMYPEANLNGQFIQITKNSHIFPLTPLWFWVICCWDFSCQPNTIELNVILFAFGSFHSELFSTKDKNSENWPQFSAPLSMWNPSLKQCILKSLLFIWRISYVLKHFKTAQHFWAVPPVLCQTQKWRFNTTLKIHFASSHLVSGKHMPRNRERDVSLCILE